LDIPVDEIKERGRLQSGEMMGLDLKNGRVMKNEEINDYLKARADYNGWLNENMNYLQEYIDSPNLQIEDIGNRELEEKQRYFNITHEGLDQDNLGPYCLARLGKEGVTRGLMGGWLNLLVGVSPKDYRENFSRLF